MAGGQPVEQQPERCSSSGGGASVPAPALAAAEAALAGGSPASCLALLSALPAAQRRSLPARRLQALCHIQLAGRAGAVPSWWQAFGLEAASATPADVRRQYKRLAGLVHPDKCRVAGAADAFWQVQAAADALQEAAAEAAGGERRRKRAKAGGGWPAAGGGSGSDGGSGDDDGWLPDGGGFPWWEEWDQPHGAAAAGGAAGSGAGPDAHQASAVAHVAAAATAAASDGAAAEAERDRKELQAVPLDALRAEVRQRQAALLAPPCDASGRRIPLPQLQARLRRARTTLADRVAAEAVAADAAGGGGFLP